MARVPDVEAVRFSTIDDQAIVTGDGKHIKAANRDHFDIYWGGKQWITLESKPGVIPRWVRVVPLSQLRYFSLIVEQPKASVDSLEVPPLPPS